MSTFSEEPRAVAPDGFIPLYAPEIQGNEWKYVKECLDSTWVSSVGAFVDRFERMVADYVGAKHAIATVNGTTALHIALLVAGIQPEEEVLVSAFSFIAPANAVRYVGAHPVLIDAESSYFQIDPQKVVDFLIRECRWFRGRLINKSTGRRVRAVLPVHVLGHPCDMDPILEVAEKYNLMVIEDAAESLGAKYKGHKVGSLGNIACFSFNGNKIVTTGGGGMITTNDRAMAERARHLSTQARVDPVEYIHDAVGFNYRMPNINAALGVAQMEQLDTFIDKKRKIAGFYRNAFGDLPKVGMSTEAHWAFSIYWLFNIFLKASKDRIAVRDLFGRLDKKDIETRFLWKPIHRLQPYRKCQKYVFGVADMLYQSGLSLPCSVGMTEKHLKRVCDIIFCELAPRARAARGRA